MRRHPFPTPSATRHRRAAAVTLFCVLAAASALVGPARSCAGPGALEAEAVWPDPPPQGPVWPASPEPARIKYIMSLAEPKDAGAGPSLLGRLANAVLGRKRQPRLLRPRGLAVDRAGRLLVADPDQQMVHVFDAAGRKYSYLEPAPFASPVGVAVGLDNTIYVSDSARRLVFVYDASGRLRATFGRLKGELIFGRPTGLAVGPDGRLFVVDTLAASIYTLDPGSGRVLGVIGRRGTGDGEFNFPTDIAVGHDGALCVVDALNARVQVFGRDGALEWSFGKRGLGTGDLDKPKGIAVDADGHIYVSEGLHDVVQIFDRTGRLLLVVGQTGSGPGQFSMPAGMIIDRASRLYVADALNSRVQVFQYVSQPDTN